ncbi:MAG: hypothetical protein GX752_01920 [Clostridium sp.]|nr:hypothetical protein [Clostridium sp.]
MDKKIMVVTHSILNQLALAEDKRLTEGPIPVIKDLTDLNVQLVQIPNIDNYYSLKLEREITEEDRNTEEFKEYTRQFILPLVNDVMDHVKKGAKFLGVLSYRGDNTQSVEPQNSPIMVEVFRLFDRKCMITPYYEIKENLSAEDIDLLITDVMDALDF